MKTFEVGDRVVVTQGARMNRYGTVVKLCQPPFEDSVRVDLDLKPRQRIADTNQLFKKSILLNLTQMEKAKDSTTTLLALTPDQKKELFDYCSVSMVAFGDELKCYEPYPKNWPVLQKLFRNKGGSWKGNKSLFLFSEQALPAHQAILNELKPGGNVPAKAHTDASLQMVPLSLIIPDPNQPRKFFDEAAQLELVESVKSKGILQPLLLRPQKGDLHGTYLLVCGERRYRAALSTNLTEVPAVIRELTDAEALELQIIENLQRKDVRPMEEAVAFKSLKEKFTIEELAARVGKSPKYVAQRAKLADLTDAWQQLVYADKIKLIDAFKVSRLSTENQTAIYKELKVPKDWNKKGWETSEWTLRQLLSQQEHDLSGAPFKTTDATLYPEMGACTNCPFNSATQPLLFEDEGKKKSICQNAVCFEIKCKRSYQKKIASALKDPETIFITSSSYLDTEDKMKLAAAEEAGAVLLEQSMYTTHFTEPEDPGMLEDYLKEGQKDEWDEDTTEEEKAQDVKDWTETYEEEKQDYDQEIKEWAVAKEKGLFKKAFVVAGHNTGKYVDIMLKSTAAEVAGDNGSFNNADVEITKIREREERNKEIDREKYLSGVWKSFQRAPS